MFLYDLGGKMESSPAGGKGGLLYHFGGPGHVCQNSSVNELRMRAEAAEYRKGQKRGQEGQWSI